MAIDFDGLNSKLEHLTASGFDVATFTLLFWANADGLGETSFGEIFAIDETMNAIDFGHKDSANSLYFVYKFNLVNGEWSFPATDLQWNAVGLSYDRGSTANDPVARVNFANVAVTRQIDPSGSALAPNTGYCIGNNTGQGRTWDGGLMHLFFHNVILSAADMDKQLRYPGSVTTGGVLWAPMLNQNYTKTFTVSAGRWVDDGANPTGTNLGARSNTGLNCLVSRKLISIPKRLRVAA